MGRSNPQGRGRSVSRPVGRNGHNSAHPARSNVINA